jgi:hypothetical protein
MSKKCGKLLIDDDFAKQYYLRGSSDIWFRAFDCRKWCAGDGCLSVYKSRTVALDLCNPGTAPGNYHRAGTPLIDNACLATLTGGKENRSTL